MTQQLYQNHQKKEKKKKNNVNDQETNSEVQPLL